MIKICMLGLGTTGKEIAKYFLGHPEFKLVMAVTKPHGEEVGQDLGSILGLKRQGVRVIGSDRLAKELRRTKPDVAVDFTSPLACMENTRILIDHGVRTVICTTGFEKHQLTMLEQYAHNKQGGIVIAPNITVGINVLMNMARKMAQVLDGYDVEIVEHHHRLKKDAPSATAEKIARCILGDPEFNLAEIATYGRQGLQRRQQGEIGIHALRGGGIVGVHEVHFIGDNERITVRHESLNRSAFAGGVARAVKFIHGRSGVYCMEDVLDLREEVSPQICANCLGALSV